MMGNTELSMQQCRTLAMAAFQDLAAEVDDGLRLDPLHFDQAQLEQQVLSEERTAELERRMQDGQEDGEGAALADRLLWQRGFERDSIDSNRFRDLVEGVMRAMIEQQRLFRFRLEDRLAPYEPVDTVFRSACVEVAPAHVGNSAGVTLGAAIDEYFAYGERQWVPKTVAMRRRRLARFVEFFGRDRALASITANEMRGYRDHLPDLRLKRSRGVGPRIAPKTAQLAYDDAKSFLRWAKRKQGYLSEIDEVLGIVRRSLELLHRIRSRIVTQGQCS